MINKNLCFYYWLKKRIGKERAFKVANEIEKIVLIFGMEAAPASNEAKGIRAVNVEITNDPSLIREEG